MKRPLFIYASYLPAATVSATDSAAGLDPAYVLEAEEDNVWQPANQSGAKSLTIDLGTLLEVGCLGIAGEYLNGASLEVRGSTDNFALSDVRLSAPAPIEDFTSTWRAWNNAPYRQVRLIFTNLASGFSVAHVAVCRFELLPFFADGMDLDAIRTEGSQLISPDGRFLGSNRLRTMRVFDLIPGKLNDAAYLMYQRWAEVCVHQLSPFFLVPDSSQADAWFCWLADPKFVFKAPRSAGVRNMPAIPVTARVP
jgi:hypothetical protein